MFLKNIRMISALGRGLALSRNSVLRIPRRNRYMLLVPEIGEDLPQKYPMLKENKDPEFSTITIEKCIAVIGRQSFELEEAVRTLEQKIENVNNVTPESLFNDVLTPLEEQIVSLQITWSFAKILYLGQNSLVPTQCYLGIHERARRSCASRYLSVPIYLACKNIINNKEQKLTDEQRGILRKYILEGKLNGLELQGKDRLKHNELALLLYRKLKDYSSFLQTGTDQFTFTIRDPMVVRNFPNDVLKSIATDSTQADVGPWKVTLDPVVMNPFMEHCPVRDLRYKVWDANVTRGSTLQERLIQTSTLLEEIRYMRNRKAKMLGYEWYADLSMETKMAGSVENVYNTLDTLLDTALPAQEYELKELNEFANKRGFEGELQQWDIPFWGRTHLETVYNYQEEDFKNYFPLPKVLSGVFQLIETLFSVKIVESEKADAWHKDVRFFDLFDLTRSSTDPVSSFYLDSYARVNEKVRVLNDMGCMVTIKGKSKVCDTKPLIAMIFNFQPPVDTKPSLLSVHDVRVLFQQFGHMLRLALTTVETSELSGYASVEWDASRVSDFFFENWLFEPFVLNQISGHKDTGKPLPKEMVEAFTIARTNLSGYNLCRELYLSRFDLELYSCKSFWGTIMNRLWSKYFVIPQHKRDCHICSFDIIFSGDYPAAYYSNVWSRMLAADVYDAFKEVSSSDKDSMKEVGSRYRETFLALGGCYPMKEIFRMFRGRDHNPKTLLNNLRLDTKSNLLKGTIERIEKP